MLKRQLIAVLVITLMLTPAVVPIAHAQTTPPPTAPSTLVVPVSGTVQGAGRATGTFNILKFVEMQDPNVPTRNILGAAGTLTLTTARGDTLVTQAVMPVQASVQPGSAGAATGAVAALATACDILNLTLGPLDLNLAGLLVHLDTVHLVISANPALGLLGQLLGGLLCGGTLGGLLNNLTGLIAALNSLLQFLNTI
jgi:hypothetical protein